MFDFLTQTETTLEEIQKTIKGLPLPDKIKAIAIYKRYKQIRKIEEEMRAATRLIEKKFLKHDQPLLTNISELVEGKRAIKQQELNDLDKYLTEDEKKDVNQHLDARQIDGYWFKCLENCNMIKNNLGKDDQPLLRCITDVRVVDEEEGCDDFTVVFNIKENQIIKNKELRKKFFLKNDTPVKAQGTVIEWVGRNLTLKEVKKKQKNKKTGQQRVVTKQVKAKSFFNFFTSIDISNMNPNVLQCNQQQVKQREELEQDFELAGVLVDEVMPYSLEYYLGIKHESDDQYGDEEEAGQQSDEQEGDKKKSKKVASKSNSKSKEKPKNKSKGKDKKEEKQEEKPECKQQ